MNKTMRRLTILFAAVCVFMIMAVPAFAASGQGWYQQTGTPQSYTNPITVKLVLQSRKYGDTSDYINAVYNVTLGEENMTATSFKVIDALVAFNDQQNAYEALESTGDYITETDSVLYNIRKVSTNHIIGPALFDTNHNPLDGWMFKVNGKFPTSTNTSTNPQGLDVSHTYIADGDVIYFYTDCPWKINNTVYSTEFLSADTSYSNGTLTVTLKKNQNYYMGSGNTATWTIDDYSNYTPQNTYAATVTDKAGNFVKNVTLYNGTGSATCSLTSGQDYYVSVMGTRDWHYISGIDALGSSVTVGHLLRTIAYDKVNH